MTRLTNSKRDSIADTETKLKFHDGETKLEKLFKDELDKLAKKTVPKCITDEVLATGYVNTSSNVTIEGMELGYNRRKLKSIDNYYPTHRHQSLQVVASTTLKNLLAKITKLEEKKYKYRSELQQVLYSYNNSKKLLVAIPELKNHFQDAVASQALVPIDQIKEVRKSLVRW